jgi:hypothetical protein
VCRSDRFGWLRRYLMGGLSWRLSSSFPPPYSAFVFPVLAKLEDPVPWPR